CRCSRTRTWPSAPSQPRTSSSCVTSRSCFGHHRFCLIGVRSSRCRRRNEMSDWRAADFVAGASPTGIVTSPKLSEPFQVVRMLLPFPFALQSRRTAGILDRSTHPCSDKYIAPMAAERTIPRLWQDAVAKKRSRPAYLVQHHDHWHEVTWEEAATRVEALANGLLARGIRKGDAFGILARTTLEWALFDFALAHVGGVTAPVYATSAPKDVDY